MLLPRKLWPLALTITSATAFKDTSPFLLLSSTPIRDELLPSSHLARADSVRSNINSILESCEWDSYILVSQPSASAADFASGGDLERHLKRWYNDDGSASLKSVGGVAEVVGPIDVDGIGRQLELGCQASAADVDANAGFVPIGNVSKRVMRVSFAPLPHGAAQRKSQLGENDSFIHAILSGLRRQKYIVIYTTTPPSDHPDTAPIYEPPQYEMEDAFASALHMDLKRDVEAHASISSTVDPSLPLFEKYQFFTPALFMGILVSVLLFLMLYVGVSAVASVQVSYFSFCKEMGPAAQKKQLQQ